MSIPEEPKISDYYSDLGLKCTATLQEIKRAHHSLAKKFHPDKQGIGACADAFDFRRIREAYECLRDSSKRSAYDLNYPWLQEQWTQYRLWQEDERQKEKAKQAEEISRQRKAAEAEKVRRDEEEQRVAIEKAERERKARLEREKLIKMEKERLAREKYEYERSRKLKEELAERKTRETAHRARMEQENAAKERLRRQKENEAERKSKEAAKKARQDQKLAAEARLKTTLIAERQHVLRQNWTGLRQAAENRRFMQATSEAQPFSDCEHPRFGWVKKKRKTNCDYCGENCLKFHFQCPDCVSRACQICKAKHCIY